MTEIPSSEGQQTLVTHHDIQTWAGRHNGMPAMRRVPDAYGGARAELSLRFHREEAPAGTPSLDNGPAPCSWTAWLAELDRQQLAVRVTDADGPRCELVKRSTLR